MSRIIAILLVALVGLTACDAPTDQLGPDGKPLPRLYRIHARDEAKIQYRMLDSINALRSAAGAPPVVLNANLNAAAATPSRDMHVQNRPWHFGSDGSSPLDRVARVVSSVKEQGRRHQTTCVQEHPALNSRRLLFGIRDDIVLLTPAAEFS